MKKLLILAFASLCVSAHAQTKGHQIPYTPKCTLPEYCQDCTDTRPILKGQNMHKFVSKQMNWRKLEDITGVIILDVVVDTNGKSCLAAIHNHTLNSDAAVMELGFENIFNDVSGWKPGTKAGKRVNTIMSVAVYCQVKGREAFDVGYTRYGTRVRWEPANGKVIKQVIDGSDLDGGFDKEEKVIRR
jgi:hypothetical protein